MKADDIACAARKAARDIQDWRQRAIDAEKRVFIVGTRLQARIEALEAALRDAAAELDVAAMLTESESLLDRFTAASTRARAALAQTGETTG